jgi:hypothetical protein
MTKDEVIIFGIIIYDRHGKPVRCTCRPSSLICSQNNCPRNKNIDHEYDVLGAAVGEAFYKDKNK